MESKNLFSEDATPTDPVDQEPPMGLGSNQCPRTSAPCYDCSHSHLPKRVVCCIDGTWMGPDGEVGAEKGASSNMFRIWASVKEGEVQDSTGKRWLQVRKYFQGIDAESPGLWSGITGEGFERLIFQVYKLCAYNCCPSLDEVYLFDFSRGAFVARAVGALLYYLQTLKPWLPNFDEEYQRCIKLYKGMRDCADFHKNKLYHHLSTNALPPISVKFVGVIDTAKTIEHKGLYDIQQTPNVSHVRHAMALLERREAYALERCRKTTVSAGSSMLDRTCIEAWFLGSHGNLGGCEVHDSLALWPLQYLLVEAQKQGLVLGFKPHGNAKTANPIDLSMPDDSLQYCIPFNNGLAVDMWDLSRYSQNGSGMRPIVRISSTLLRESERYISDSDLTTTSTTDGFCTFLFPCLETNKLIALKKRRTESSQRAGELVTY